MQGPKQNENLKTQIQSQILKLKCKLTQGESRDPELGDWEGASVSHHLYDFEQVI